MRKEEEEEGKEEAVGKAEEGKTRKGKASKPESNPPNIHKYIRVSKKDGLPYECIQYHWIFKKLRHPVIIYGLQDCKSFLYDLGAWIMSSGTHYTIQPSLRSSPLSILDASLSSLSAFPH